MTTKAKWRRGILEYYNDQTYITQPVGAPFHWEEDFTGLELMTTESGSTGPWGVVEVNLNTAIAVAADVANGAVDLIVDADSNAEDAVLYHGDQRNLNVAGQLSWECRLAMPVLATTAVAVVWGVANDHNLDKDTVAAAAWFRCQASGAVVVETDDTTNNNDDVSTGITLVAGAYHVFRIDFHDLSDVRFYIDGASVGTGTTFDMSNLTAAEAVMQPYFSLDKASGTGVGTMRIDYVHAWGYRDTQ